MKDARQASRGRSGAQLEDAVGGRGQREYDAQQRRGDPPHAQPAQDPHRVVQVEAADGQDDCDE